jgi:hypothetical protein
MTEQQQSYPHLAFPGADKEDSFPGATASRLTGVLLILSVVGFFLPFVILLFGLGFLDQSPGVALSIYHQQSATVLLSFYGYVWGGLLLSLAVFLLSHILQSRGGQSLVLRIATVCGVLGGMMQAVGDIRWPFLLPSLDAAYFDPHASQATRAAIAVVFQAVEQTGGGGLSEHLYFLLVGAWSLLLGWSMLRSSFFARWIGWLGIIGGCFFFVGSIETFNLPGFTDALKPVLLLSHILWGVLLVVLALKLFSHRVKASDIAALEQKV